MEDDESINKFYLKIKNNSFSLRDKMTKYS